MLFLVLGSEQEAPIIQVDNMTEGGLSETQLARTALGAESEALPEIEAHEVAAEITHATEHAENTETGQIVASTVDL